MSDEQDKLKASLEPPRLFGRKKKKPGSTGAAKPATASSRGKAEAAESTKPTEQAEPDVDAESSAPAIEDDSPASDATPTEPAEAAAATEEAAPEPTAVIADEPVDTDTDDTQVIESEPEPEDAPVAEDVPAPEPASEPAPEREASTIIEPDTDDVDDVPASDDSADAPAQPEAPRGPSTATRLADRVRSRWGPKPTPAPADEDEPHEPVRPAHGQIQVEPEPVSEAEVEDAEIAARGTAYTEPMLAPYPAAALTGAIVGIAMVVLTWLSLRGCEAIRGTATCGGGPGFLLLLATFVVSVMLGNAILKSFLVPDPGSSSFLAVGLVAVVALLLLIDALDSWVMLIAIPLISIAAYLLSVYVTKTFVEPAEHR